MTASGHQNNRAEGASGINARQGRSSGGRVVRYAKELHGAQSQGAQQGATPQQRAGAPAYDQQVPPVQPKSYSMASPAGAVPPSAVPAAIPVGIPNGGAAKPVVMPKQKRKHRAAFWVALVVVIMCVVLACLLLLNTCDGKSKRQGSLGQLEGKTDEEIQAEINRVVDEGMFNISIASIVQMENGSAPAELRIENVPGNHYLMKVDIVRDDTGEKIYETDLIEPNYHIQEDTLDVSLPAGDYECTAIFQAFDMDTEESIGQAAAKILIQVAK